MKVTAYLPLFHSLLLLRRKPLSASAFLFDATNFLSTKNRDASRRKTMTFSSSRPYVEGKVCVKRNNLQQETSPSAFPSAVARKKKKKRRTKENHLDQTDSVIELTMYYRIFNPEHLSINQDDSKEKRKAPIIVLHGGPSLPSQYLYSIADNVPTDRPIIFYDQIGCGRSSEPRDINFYSISQSVDDLETLLRELNIQSFHVLGHSYGGVLAYEYAMRVAERAERSTCTCTPQQQLPDQRCLSGVLANTSTNMRRGNDEWERLLAECSSDSSLPGATPYDRFFRRNQCRLDVIPQDLSLAFDHCGKVWFGTDVVADWVAKPLTKDAGNIPAAENQRQVPPFLLVTGQYDFVTQSCTSEWSDKLGDALVEETIMKDCSHYVHLEQPTLFGSILEAFVSRWETL